VADINVVPVADAMGTDVSVVSTAWRRRRQQGGNSWVKVALLVVVAAVGVAVAVWGVFWLRVAGTAGQGPTTSAGNVLTLDDYNCQLDVPPAPWKQDNATKLHLHVNLAMSRADPPDHVALFLKDYKTRTPTEGELVGEGLDRLRSYFGASLEWQARPPDEEARLGGKPALLVEFAGNDPNQVPVRGEYLALTRRGYGYWFFTWGPEDRKDELQPQWQALRHGFHLLGGREGWKERPRPTQTAVGGKAAYTLTYPDDLWKRKDAGEFDPAADLVLEAFEPEPGSRPHAGKAAHLQALVLPAAPDLKGAVAAAREHLARRLEEEGQPRVKLDPVQDKGRPASSRETEVGELRGQVVPLRVVAEDSGSYDRFVLLAVVRRPEGCVILQGDCDWNRRDFWELEFRAVFRGLKAR
jgi:hypothetical protein